ncbi:hypothetical protein J7E29_02450 [Streptomyces sp. ISL-90]|nr:hypothetical protein [Streptomyces sp. ISL-90]
MTQPTIINGTAYVRADGSDGDPIPFLGEDDLSDAALDEYDRFDSFGYFLGV